MASIPPDGETSEEERCHTDLVLFVVKGNAKMTLNSKLLAIGWHEVILVPAGSSCKLKNSGQDDLKLLAIYTPPEYLDGTICKTQQEAQAATKEALRHAWEQ